jgi:hypothetical protein
MGKLTSELHILGPEYVKGESAMAILRILKCEKICTFKMGLHYFGVSEITLDCMINENINTPL